MIKIYDCSCIFCKCSSTSFIYHRLLLCAKLSETNLKIFWIGNLIDVPVIHYPNCGQVRWWTNLKHTPCSICSPKMQKPLFYSTQSLTWVLLTLRKSIQSVISFWGAFIRPLASQGVNGCPCTSDSFYSLIWKELCSELHLQSNDLSRP